MKPKVLVPVLLLILGASAAAVWFTANGGENGPSVTKPGGNTSTIVDGGEKIDISDWKVYENSDIGIKFMYPKNWEVSVDKGDSRVGLGYKVVLKGLNPDNRRDPFGNIDQDSIFIRLSSKDYRNEGSEEHNHLFGEKIDLTSDSAVKHLIANTNGAEKAYMYNPAISDNDFAILYSYTEWQGFIANVYAFNQNTHHKFDNISINYPIGYEIKNVTSVEDFFKSFPKTNAYVFFNTLLSTFEFEF